MANKLYKPILIDSIKASEDVIQQRFIGFDGKYCQAGAKAFGVSDVDMAKDQYLSVAISGILLIEAGGTFTVGSQVSSDENGKAIKTEGSAISNGYALDDATEGQIVRIVRGIS